MNIRTRITRLLEPFVEVVAILLPKNLRMLLFNSNWWFDFYEKHTTRHKEHIEQIRYDVQKVKDKALRKTQSTKE